MPASTCTSASPCKLAPIWSAHIGTASKFAIPATDGGRVYVGTRDGHVLGFGVKTGSTPAAALGGAAPVTFAQAAVGAKSTANVTVTASAGVTVSGVSAISGAAADPFTVGQVTETPNGSSTPVPVTFPVTLSKGDALHAPVTFAPTAPGGAAGALSFATTLPARSVPENVPRFGEGTRTGLYATPSSVQFAVVGDSSVTNVPVGTSELGAVDITNGGTTPQTVTSVTPPTGPFSAAGLPAPGSVIKPGQSVTVQLTFAPQRGRADRRLIRGPRRQRRDRHCQPVRDRVAPVSRFTVSPRTVNFGTVPLDRKVTARIDVANTGNQPATVTGVAPLRPPFRAPLTVARGLLVTVARGLPVNPGEDLAIPVTFTPARTGTFTGVYRLTWTDRFGMHILTVVLTGIGTQ